MHDVFISYARDDRARVKRLADKWPPDLIRSAGRAAGRHVEQDASAPAQMLQSRTYPRRRFRLGLLTWALCACAVPGVLLGLGVFVSHPVCAAQADQNAAARASVAQALYAASATNAAAERAADTRIAEQRKQIEALQTQLKASSGRDASEQVRMRDLQTQLAQAQERFVAQLAERDRAYAVSVAPRPH